MPGDAGAPELGLGNRWRAQARDEVYARIIARNTGDCEARPGAVDGAAPDTFQILRIGSRPSQVRAASRIASSIVLNGSAVAFEISNTVPGWSSVSK
jgi:hypothetical protein